MKSCLVLGFAMSACMAPDDGDLGRVEQEVGGACPVWMCGMNSPVIDTFGFHELNLDLQPTPDGLFTLTSFKGANGVSYQMSVTNGMISGIDANGNWIGHGALVGADMLITINGVGIYDIRIVDVSRTEFWAVPARGPQYVETYVFQWSPTLRGGIPTSKWRPVCPTPPAAGDTLGMDQYHTVVFEGERIEAKSKTITGIDKRWFNLGCAGSTLAKLQLTGHTQAATGYGFQTSVAQRQTMLKMLSADYCGGGQPFTVAGVRLDWADDLATMKFTPTSTETLEARWTSTGPVCLNKPRIAVNPTTLSQSTFPGGVDAAITASCTRPPPCDDLTLATDGYHLVTANP